MDLLKISKFSKLNSPESYLKELKRLKTKLLLKTHLHYTDNEIHAYLRSLHIELPLIDLIMKGLSRDVLITSKSKLDLMNLWFEQYIDYGVSKTGKHYPDLIIFDFQKREIKTLLNHFASSINSSNNTKEFIKGFIKKIIQNEYRSFGEAMSEYYKHFNVKAVVEKSVIKPKDRKIIGVPKVKEKIGYKFPEEHDFGDFIGTKNNRPVRKFLSRLKKIIEGAERSKTTLYKPFFMENKKIYAKVKKFLRFRLKKVIKEYYPQFRKKEIDSYKEQLDRINLDPEITLNQESYSLLTLLDLPPINLSIFGIDWDFMPQNLGAFYDGYCQEQGKRAKTYTIAVHPLPLYLAFINRKRFAIFIDQLLHHEFIHLLQYRITYIHDAFLLDDNFREDYPIHYNFLSTIAKPHFIEEEIPKKFPAKTLQKYILNYGGHTEAFKKEVQKFKECEKAMRVRKKIENLYSGFRYKLWGSEIPSTVFWILCEEDIIEQQKRFFLKRFLDVAEKYPIISKKSKLSIKQRKILIKRVFNDHSLINPN